MVENILVTLANSTPDLRARYLDRIRSVAGPDARALERELEELVARDRGRMAA